jgi:hypothetical protein
MALNDTLELVVEMSSNDFHGALGGGAASWEGRKKQHVWKEHDLAHV